MNLVTITLVGITLMALLAIWLVVRTRVKTYTSLSKWQEEQEMEKFRLVEDDVNIVITNSQ
jgi:hypothetical protein